jgi:transcriptional regulator with XRE-family HTH domain
LAAENGVTMSLNKRIGQKLKTYRTNGGRTQEQFARRLGVTRGFLSDIERGVKAISIETLARICKRTGLKPAALLGV